MLTLKFEEISFSKEQKMPQSKVLVFSAIFLSRCQRQRLDSNQGTLTEGKASVQLNTLWTNLNKQYETWADFSTVDVGIFMNYTHKNSLKLKPQPKQL